MRAREQIALSRGATAAPGCPERRGAWGAPGAPHVLRRDGHDTLALTDLLAVSDLLLASGKVRLRIASRSMVPALAPGDEIVVEPAATDTLSVGDLILFEQVGRLICHRLVEACGESPTLLTRGDAVRSAGERIHRDQVIGKVVGIRKRTLWAALVETGRHAFLPVLLRWLPRLQRLKVYRILMRPLVAPFLSYHLGLAESTRWYSWRKLGNGSGLPVLPRSARPHLLTAKLGGDVVGWSELSFRDSAWRSGDLYVRLRYRGLGLESDFGRMARLVTNAR